MTTGNLELPEMLAGTAQREVVFNDLVDALDAVLTSKIVLTVDDSNEETVSKSAYIRNVFFDLTPGTPPPDGDIDLFFDDTKRGFFVVRNGTAENVTVSIIAQSVTPGVLAAGEIGEFITDGDNIYMLGKTAT
jgi:hypothetical protein